MKKLLFSLLICCCFLSVQAQTTEDEKAIRQAILNYVESFYQADTTKVYASVHPELAKRGYYKRNNAYTEATMSFDQMVRLSSRWNKNNPVPADAPKDITLFEVKDKIASAKLKAMWGTDYFHLAKIEGNWKIINVMWQD